jgi:hypothetical protein
MRKLFFVSFFCLLVIPLAAQQKTYCNPLNVDYSYTPVAGHTERGRHRSAAHPAIVSYRGDYYLFATNQSGYWWSANLAEWHFVHRSFLPPELMDDITQSWQDLHAPAVWVQGGALHVLGSAYSNLFPIWVSTNPKENEWRMAVERFKPGGEVPTFFVDDDDRLYMYNSGSNEQLIYGVELHAKTFQPAGARKELIRPEHMALSSAVESAWMTKHEGKYYLQWSASGQQGNGLAIGAHPLGAFQQTPLPAGAKAGGFAGGGVMFRDHWDNYWSVSTMEIGVKHDLERRIGIWPAGFDADGTMYCNTAFGDYPQYLPDGEADHRESRFTGWMLLNYNKPVRVSSTLGTFAAAHLVDEDMKTHWSAATGEEGEWFISDLGGVSTVRALQINYADQDATTIGKSLSSRHEYAVSYSTNGKKWRVLFSKKANTKDIPHDYVELEKPVEARYIKVENLSVPTGKFAVSGFRVFGLGHGNKPDVVDRFTVLRDAADRRNARLTWQPADGAYAYNIYIGESPDKLYHCVMVYDAGEYYYRGLDGAKPYYFAIEAVNENGTSDRVRAEAL